MAKAESQVPCQVYEKLQATYVKLVPKIWRNIEPTLMRCILHETLFRRKIPVIAIEMAGFQLLS